MRKLNGVFLVLLGVTFLYLFAINGVVGTVEKGLSLIDDGIEKKVNLSAKENDVLKGADAIHKAVDGGATLPFHALGINYPGDVLFFIVGICLLFWGIALLFSRGRVVVTATAPAETGSRETGGAATGGAATGGTERKTTSRPAVVTGGARPSTLLFANAALLLLCEWAAYVGSPYEGNERSVAVFALVIAAQIVCGLVLGIMAIREKRKSLPALVFGGGLFAAGLAVAVLAVLAGM